MEQIIKPEDFLKSGKQTQITDDIKNIADSINGSGNDLIFGVLKAVFKKLKPDYSQDIKRQLLRTRTASEILKSGFATGCTDYAFLTIAIFRAKGIPAVYVESFRRKWLDGNEEFVEGHVLTEIFLDGKWIIVDPEEACIRGWYNRFVVYKRGIDSWNIGIKNIQDLKEVAFKFREEYKARLKSGN